MMEKKIEQGWAFRAFPPFQFPGIFIALFDPKNLSEQEKCFFNQESGNLARAIFVAKSKEMPRPIFNGNHMDLGTME